MSRNRMMDSQRACSTGELTTDGCGLVGSGRTMHHSHSTPAGVDGGARTPPATPKKGGKMLAVRVQMLDDSITMFQIQAKALGRVLFDQVCKQLHLLEADYFGLEYQDLAGTRYWLDLQKPVSRQLGLSLIDPLLRFCVKFYTPDPGQLEEEFTRYLFCLQIKRDLSQAHLQCNDNTAALMASYIVQAECGDYVAEDYPDHTYLSSYKFVPHQDHELECRIMENHKKHAGQSPAEADLNLLETARRCELYGMKMHPAKDHDGITLNLSVAHMGIVVFQHFSKINTFSWAKIRKISFKRKRFLIKLHPESYGVYKDLVEFYFEGRNECKNFWKKCVEHHGFFRCAVVKNISRHKTRVISRGSSFRYSGKTQKQMVEFVRDNYVKRQTFQRSASFRHSAHSSAVNVHAVSVGTSISAHPLLPLADPSLAEELDKASRMESARAGRGASQTTRSAYRRQGTATHSPRSSITLGTPTPDSPTVLVEDTTVTTSSPSPPLTTQSVSVEICTSTSRVHDAKSRGVYRDEDIDNSTGQKYIPTSYITTHTHTTIPPMYSNETNVITNSSSLPHNTKYTPKSEGSLYYINPIQPDTTSTHSQTVYSHYNDHFDYNQTLPKSNLDCRTAPDYSYDHLSYKQNNSQLWQRSASCRDLYDFTFENQIQSKTKTLKKKSSIEKSGSQPERKLESPVTRYDDSHKSLYNVHSNRNTSLDIQQDIIVLDHKIYSSSYPGTVTLSQESMEDPGNYELAESQDDLSHDSYELLERSDDDLSSSAYRYRHSYPSDKTRSGSLDSGNYIQSVSDSDDSDRIHHYKSTSDVHQDIFMMDDPRDLPREKNPPKSDGSFYRTVKLSSRTSSLESKSDYYDSMGSSKKLSKVSSGSRTSSLESKSDRESKQSKKSSEPLEQPKTTTTTIPSPKIVGETLKSTSSKPSEFIFPALNNDYNKQTNNDTAKSIPDYDSFPSFKETTPHVHSVSLQNVETEQNIRNHRAIFESELNTIPRTQRSSTSKSTHIWPENICGLPTEIQNLSESASRSAKSDPGQSSKSIAQVESNIFSFDDDKIKELKDSDYADGLSDQYPYPPLPILDNDLPEPIVPDNFPVETTSSIVSDFIDSSKGSEQLLIDGEDMDKYQAHLPIERTKSDPNNITNRPRLGPNSRRHTLMHQKSIDLTPAESSDEDYLYRQIPSAPPLSKGFASHFEMPTAEFGHFDILQRDVEGTKTKFEVPKSQFEVLGAKTQFDLINLPPKDSFDIPYILHKRHVMNGTAPKVEPTNKVDVQIVDVLPKRKLSSDISSPKNLKPELEKALEEPIQPPPQSQFLFTQNVDLSNINPITLEIDKNDLPVLMSSPKRDITKIDPSVLETLNMKLSRIESDSPPHSFSIVDESKTVLNKVDIKQKNDAKNVFKAKYNADIINKARKDAKDGKPKRINKPRSQNKKSSKNKGKVRITSFSSDDESLDSDDVFGSAEATPTKLEFSPPQHRKEMESILKYESERQTHLQYTMSSTEIEGSPPQPRKSEILPYDRSLDVGHTELRRISERSLSIPSSEEDGGTLKPPLQTLPEAKDLSPSPDKETPKDTEAKKAPSEKESPIEKPSTINLPSTLLGPSEMPTTTVKSTEIIQTKLKSFLADADTTLIRRGQTPGLFAHARLNLSEGTGFTLMQRQTAVQSPTSSRRAKSLDTAVVSVTNLPPPNAFSSKDDTLDSLETDDSIDKDILKSTTSKSDLEKTPSVEAPKLPSDDEVLPSPPPPPVKEDKEVKEKILSDVEEPPKKDESKAQVKASKLGLKIDTSIVKSPNSSKTSTPTSGGVKKSPKGTIIKDKSLEKQKSPKLKTAGPLRAVKSQETEQSKKQQPKEKSKSFEKLELKRISSKERSKSQDDNELSIRRKKQQILYETAIKQTKTLKSPVKETLPTFPIVEDSVSVSDGKLEIKIDVTNFTIPDDAIIITKSPKKLDKKLTKSLELNFPDDPFGTEKQVGRLGKSLDLEQRKTEIDSDSKPGFSTEAGDTSEETSDIESETNDPIPPSDMEEVPPDIIADIQIPNGSSESKHHVLSQQTLSVDVDDVKSTKSTSPDTKPISGSLSPATTIPESMSDKKIEKDSIPVRIIPKIKSTEEESLTEVSDIRGDLIKKLSTERSRSEDTASWITVECEEVIGLDDEEDLSLHLNDEDIIPEDPNFLHTNQVNAATKNRMMKFGDTRSRSSDTTGSWTSGEKDPSPVQQPGKSDESSVSCSIIRPFGISQQIEIYETREQLENELLKNLSQEVTSDTSEKALSEKAHSEKGYSSEKGSSDKSSRSPLKRSSPVDEESSSSGSGGNGNKPIPPPEVFITHKQSLLNTKTSSKSSTDTSSLTVSSFEHDGKVLKGKYPFEQKWLSDKELQKGRLRSYSRISSASDRSTYSSLEDSMSGGSFDKRNGSLDKPRIRSIDNLSIESKNSLDTESRLDTESSSGSLGVAYRLQKTGEAPTIEASSTWRPFLIDSESSSVEDGLLPPDQDLDDKEYFLSRDSYARFRCDDDEDTMTNLDDVNTTGVYGPNPQQANTTDVVPNYGHTAYLSRTLSRISERSSNSEKSSLDENSSKHSMTHYDSMNEESLVSSDQPASLSSDSSSADAKPLNEDLPKAESSINKKISSSSSIERSPSNKNSSGDKFKPQSLLGCNLTRQISDDRRTSAEMADLSLDEVELIMAEDKLRRQNSDDTIIEENSEEEEEEECGTPQLKCSSSQESEDWPLPEIPVTASSSNFQSNQHQTIKTITPLSSMEGDSPPRIPIMEDYQLPKVFGLRGSLQSQDSGQWPSPPSSAVYDPPPEYVGDIEVAKTYYIQAEKACKVVVQDSISDATPELENEVFVDQTLIDELSKSKSDSSGSDNSFDLPKNEILLDTKYSSEEEAAVAATVVVKPPIPPKKHGMLSKQTTIQQISPHSSDEDRSNSENITKSDGVSLSESKNMTTVLFQNISGSYSGTSKSFKGPGGLKDDDSSLFDNLSLSEWSSSNSHPLGPNSPHSKSSLTHDLENGQKSTTPEKMGTFTKSTERPVKIPPAVTSPTAIKEDVIVTEIQQSSTHSSKVSLQQVKSLQKSVSYDQNKSSPTGMSTFKSNSNFKTVPLVRSHRSSGIAKKSSTIPCELASTSSSNVSVSSTSDEHSKRKGTFTQVRKSKLLRQKSNDTILKHKEKPDKENLENVSSQNNNNSLYNISSNSTSPTSPDLQQPTTTVLNNSVNNNINGNHVDENGKKKYRWPTDKSFFIAKEILMTEKIYKKDLDVINEYWRNEFGTEEMEEVAELLLSLVSPLATVHAVFARDLDSCLQGWENHSLPLGDILLNNIPTLLPLYEEYLDGHTLVLEQLDIAFRRNPRFEQLYRDFELQKVCYLPFTSFILKPLHRLLQYQNLIDRLLESYDENRSDRASCIAARAALTPLLSPAKETLKHSENLATLHELQRDIVGFDILGTPGRNFLRLGCLLKHSRKGYQQRMFFLFSDILLYTSRVQGAAHFRVHGHMPLRGVMIDEPEKALAKYAFTIYGGNRALAVAANSQYEKDCWVTDLQDALQKARDHTDSNLTYLSLKSCCSSDEIIDKQGLDGCSSTERPSMPLQRNNTTVQVCWHRNTTISMVDQLLSIKNQLSGYLLRKFKNSNGWQKLWVVFTSFCLFFYKSSTEDFPLASLPVLGYTIGTPSPSDNISKEFVFKLQYKNHVYFFRSESNYTFQRWLEVIGSATNRSVEQNGNELTQGF